MHHKIRTMKLHAYALILSVGMILGTVACAEDITAGITSPAPHAERPETATTPSSEAASFGSEGETHEDRWNAHAQSTYVWQNKNSFNAPYTGAQSLITSREHGYTLTATAYLGARLWQGAEIYFNPEGVQGRALSSFFGLAGVQNGELQKNGGGIMREYWARAFLRQTLNLGGERFHVDDGLNQLASNYDKHRLVLTLGKMTQTDLFERSSYANDPRSQFLNWALITHGAWDFAADARAYTI